MRIVLRQEFPLGRFHATPWRVNPFDDPHGEWPPSPWRLIRAVAARWYQWAREAEQEPNATELENLLAALCGSTYTFHLPADARKGSPLRQYHPTEFGMDPPNWRHVACFQRAVTDKGSPEEKANNDTKAKVKALKDVKLSEKKDEKKKLVDWEITVKDKGADNTKKKVEDVLGVPSTAWQRVADAGARGYGTSLVQDNYWCISPEAPVWWFIEGDSWTPELITALEQCLSRVTYFGRAETFTRIRPKGQDEQTPESNCALGEQRTTGTVPVLTPLASATRDDIERTTDNPNSAKRAVPPGAQFLYAVRPQRPAARERRRTPAHRPDCHLMQFALGWNVAPELRSVVRLTQRFRGAVLKELLRIKTDGASTNWARVGRAVREQVADMFGKDASGDALQGPRRHAEFFVWCEDDQPTRLLVWRNARTFDADEQTAILLAAARDVSWAAAGTDGDEWKVRLVPLDRDVPAPPGFGGQASAIWESVTPYVPPRHHFRGGKERERESMAAQVRLELQRRGLTDQVEVSLMGSPTWVSVHVPRREANKRAFIGNRRGQAVRLRFAVPVTGPIRLGHSSSFGLGLFRPVHEQHQS